MPSGYLSVILKTLKRSKIQWSTFDCSIVVSKVVAFYTFCM